VNLPPVRAVVVTRAEDADGPLSCELKSLGLEVLLWPAVSVVPADPGPLAAALAEVQAFAWIVFASRHAVAAVLTLAPEPPAGVRVAAIGRSTAQALREHGWPVDLVPGAANAAALVEALGAQGLPPGARILYPASSRALPMISDGLARLGARVTQVEAYRTTGAALDVAECHACIERDGVAAVTFASPSAVTELAQALGADDFRRLLEQAAAVAIGGTTARELTARGHAAVVAASATLEGLAQTTLRLLQTR
jgi:uroporphyrinogen-III synthase